VNFVLEDIVAVHVCLLVGRTLQIVPQLQPDTHVGSADTTASIRSAGVRVRHATAMGERPHRSHESIEPLPFSRPKQNLCGPRLPTQTVNGAPHPWRPLP